MSAPLDDLLLPFLHPAHAVTDRQAALDHALGVWDRNYHGDELVTTWREAERDLARLELVNGRRAWSVAPCAAAVVVRKLAALHYRRQARAIIRLATASTVWDDGELLAIVLGGRDAIRAALVHETDAKRVLVLELALTILDDVVRALSSALPALSPENAPTPVECAHRPHRRRRAGPCLQRPRLARARRSDDPHQPRRESSHPYGATLSRLSSNPGGSR